MDRLVRAAVICGALGVALLLAPSARAQSFGCMRMPSTFAQYLGYGYGAGHHAPIVRTPGVRPERAQRMTISPAACGPLGPAPYELIGCYGGSCPGGCADGSCYGAPAAMYPGAYVAPVMAPVSAHPYAPPMQSNLPIQGHVQGPMVGPMIGPPMTMRPMAPGYVVR